MLRSKVHLLHIWVGMVRYDIAFRPANPITPYFSPHLLIDSECRCCAWLRMLVVLDYRLFCHGADCFFPGTARELLTIMTFPLMFSRKIFVVVIELE